MTLLDMTSGTALTTLIDERVFLLSVDDSLASRDRNAKLYASTIERVARGMQALAAVRPASLHSSISRVYRFPDRDSGEPFSARYKFVMKNDYFGELCCMVDPDYHNPWYAPQWSPTELGLYGIMLECEYPFLESQSTSLTIALPTWCRTDSFNTHVVALISLRLNGMAFAERHSIEAPVDGRSQMLRDQHAITDHLFGLKSLGDKNAVRDTMESGSIERILGFPGAEKVFVEQLPFLSDHLDTLAKQATPHTH